MTTQHTPRKLDYAVDGSIWDEDAKVAEVFLGPRVVYARLFAAAPEMKAALEKVAAHFEGTDAPLGALVRAALTKATLGALALVLLAGTAFAQVHEQPYTVGDPPEARHRTCVGTDAACAALGFQTENHESLAVVTDGFAENAKASVINLSEEPCDPHAIASWDAHAMGSLTSLSAYGANYCGTLSGIPLAGKSKVLGAAGMLLTTGAGRIYVSPGSTHVATFDTQGFGFGGLALAGRNTFTLGWGQCTTAPPFGELTMCAMPGAGGVYHLYVVTSDGASKCLSCQP